MKFEFDENKNKLNEQKHGITLSESSRLWDDPNHIIGPADSVQEDRWAAVGKIDNIYWLVVFTNRGQTVRVISCRRARREEIEIYEASK